MKKLLIINGPNLNMLEYRNSIYGNMSLNDLKIYTEEKVDKALRSGNLGDNGNLGDLSIEWFQSNSEGAIVDRIHLFLNEWTKNDYLGLIINPGAYSHTSIAILDALEMLITRSPIIEVHLTNVLAREDFRKTLLTARAANTLICGLGIDVYFMAIYALVTRKE